MLHRVALLFILLVVVGCVPLTRPRLDQQQEALSLIDQGTLLLRDGELDRARAAFEVANELAPSGAALDGMGCVAFATGDLNLAQQFFEAAYQHFPNYKNSIGNLAAVLAKKGDYAGATAAYQIALRENPESYRFRNNFAGHLIELSRNSNLSEAKEHLWKAAALTKHPLVLSNMELEIWDNQKN